MKKHWNRMTAICLAMLCIFSFAGIPDVQANTVTSEKLTNKKYLNAYSIGAPIEQAETVSSVVGMEDGANMLYTTVSGTTPKFVAVNLDAKEVARTFELSDCNSVWTHAIDKQGNVYMASQGGSYLFCYSPVTKQVENLGRVPGQGACYDLCFDETGNLYMGVYPGGTVVKYDVAAGTFYTYAKPREDNEYIRSLAYYDGYLYAGTYGNGGYLYKINAATGAAAEISISGERMHQLKPGMNAAKFNLKNLYEMSMVDGILFIQANCDYHGALLLTYDCEAEEFIDVTAFAIGYHVTPAYNGKVYYAAGDRYAGHPQRKNTIREFDMATKKWTKTDWELGLSARGGGWVSLTEPGYTGKTFVTVTNDGKIFVMNPETRKFRSLDEIVLPGTALQIHNLAFNETFNKLYIGGFSGGAKGAVYAPDTGDMQTFKLGQPESILATENYTYFGVYPGANLYRVKNNAEGAAPAAEHLLTIGNHQDRPYTMASGEGKIFIGTIPDYGNSGGALTVYDEETGTADVYRNILQDQSIVGLAYKDGKVYGSGSISPGLGIKPVADKASMFVFDTTTKKVQEFTPNFPSSMVPSGIKQIGDLEVGPDGLIWGAVRSYIFALDPNTLQIKKQVLLKDFQWYDSNYWRPIYLKFASDGTLYVSGNGIYVVDPDTMESINLGQYTGNLAGNIIALDSDDNVYLENGADVMKVTAVKDSGASSQRGTAEYTVSGNQITVTGTTAGKQTGKEVALIMLKSGKTFTDLEDSTASTMPTIVQHMGQATSGKGGAFTIKIVIDDTVTGGVFATRISGNDFEQPLDFNIIYVSPAEAQSIYQKFIAAQNGTTTMEQFLKENAAALGLDLTDYPAVRTGVDTYLKSVSISAVDPVNAIQEISNAFYGGMLKEMLSAAEAIDDVTNALNTYDVKHQFVRTDYEKLLAKDGGADVMKALENKSFATPEEALSALHVAVFTSLSNRSANRAELQELFEVYNPTYIGIETGAGSDYAKIDKADFYKNLGKELQKTPVYTKSAYIAAFERAMTATEKSTTVNSGNTGSTNGGGTSIAKPFPTEQPTPYTFDDLGSVSWAEESILTLADKGIIAKPADKKYRPNDNITREEFVKLLVAALDMYDVNAICDFTDVPGDAWFASYVASGVNNGLVKGISDTEFGAGRDITREDISVLIYRSAQAKGIDLSGTIAKTFTDAPLISDYAEEAVEGMAQAGILAGYEDGSFGPQRPATRAEVAVMLARFLAQ